MVECKTLDEWNPLPAERKLAEEMASGLIVKISDGTLPPADLPADDPRVIRTSFLRALILGRIKGHPPHEKGVQVQGAYLLGDGPPEPGSRGLDLESCDIGQDLELKFCRLPDPLLLRSASVRNLYLIGTFLEAGMSAARLEVKGTVEMSDIVSHRGLVLSGARIGGNLLLSRACLVAESSNHALAANATKIGGRVDLGGLHAQVTSKMNIEPTDTLRFDDSKIDGSLSCRDATVFAGESGRASFADRLRVSGGIFLCGSVFKGAVHLLGVKVVGDLDCYSTRFISSGSTGGLYLVAGEIAGTFILDGGCELCSANVSGARVAYWWDSESAWPKAPKSIKLNGFETKAFVGRSPVDAAARIRWLSLQQESRLGAEFWPQPWEECARVLREMGHGAAARDILIEKEKRQRKARRVRVWGGRRYLGPVHAVWLGFLDWVLGWSVRYGRQPLRAFLWLAVMWGIGTGAFALAEARGDLKPNLPQVQRAPEWVQCGFPADERRYLPSLQRIVNGRQAPGQTQLDCFRAQPEAAAYPAFNAALYSADTLFPVVSFEMQSFWLPDERSNVGRAVRWYLWVHIAAGWALTLLAVAGFSGLIRTDNTK